MQIDDFKHRRDIALRDWFWNAIAPRIFVTGKGTERLRHSRTLLVGFASHDRGDRAAKCPAFHAVVPVAIAHHQRSEIRVAKPERPENVRVLRDLLDGITRVINHDLLRGDENANRGLESFNVELAVDSF